LVPSFERNQRGADESVRISRPGIDGHTNGDTNRPSVHARGRDASLLRRVLKGTEDKRSLTSRALCHEQELGRVPHCCRIPRRGPGSQPSFGRDRRSARQRDQQRSGDVATVDFDFTEGGYDISASTGVALESPTVLPPAHVTATLKRVNGLWLMDSYVGHP